ncbi:DNA polymerase III subunit epsilon [Bizionia argentinensis JUB59]|uniref:DNA polymerase III subunit epsilon n=1 Tax=Bizionia argentinensis JUB59 TaxID=1046627 RepID=G2EA18_9FLAO|nr:exonuclease domain-containing protein [Bizionia argentinensis]EGV44668.1 DNA polymerase III subunit epsilon [Bizionia argentinensis JUB59]
MIYTIIDVETTGQTNRITEIAIFKYDGNQVIDEFTSLVNPQTAIPIYITTLTGIDNLMVANAPTFEDIAQDILNITEDSTFVAHNVNFDYNVIRNEFKLLDLDFNRKKLCTVRLSRKLLPGFPSYSLGKLCKSLDIEITDRHRARGDVQATVILFEMLLKKDETGEVFSSFLNKTSKEATLPAHLPTAAFNAIPNTAGVYYFKNKLGEIIYIGKAIDLKKRVLSHFYSKAQKSLDMCRETRDIDFELAGSELIALLMENAAIKQHFPKFNKQAKRNPKSYGIFSYEDRNGIIHLAYNPLKSCPNPIKVFHNIRESRLFLEELCLKFELCPKYCHLQEGVAQCGHYSIKNCKGICINNEAVADYNARVNNAIEATTKVEDCQIIKRNGRDANEEAFVLIKNGMYLGYGFIDSAEQINSDEDLDNFLIPQKDSLDIQSILRTYI